MKPGIVVVTFECREFALRCLASLEQHVPGLLSRTVVVDNDSHDGTVEAVEARFPQVRLLRRARNIGFAAAANAGIRELRDTDVVILLNPDAVLLDDEVLAAAAFLGATTSVGVLGGRIVNDDGTIQPSARRFPALQSAFFNRHSLTTKFFPRNRFSSRYLMTDWAHDDVRAVDWVSGAFMLIHRRAIERVGLLDARYFFSIEDVDYCRRVRNSGLEVFYYPWATVRHRVGGSSRKAVYRAMAAHHRGMWLYYRRHLRGNRLLDVATLGGISARFGLHAASYALRTAKNRVLRQPNP